MKELAKPRSIPQEAIADPEPYESQQRFVDALSKHSPTVLQALYRINQSRAEGEELSKAIVELLRGKSLCVDWLVDVGIASIKYWRRHPNLSTKRLVPPTPPGGFAPPPFTFECPGWYGFETASTARRRIRRAFDSHLDQYLANSSRSELRPSARRSREGQPAHKLFIYLAQRVEGKTISEIAHKYGVEPSSISRAIKAARKALGLALL